ncbi:MAG: hypothetical protein GXX11_08525 [Acholeplasmataceae bacterium]|nr:hypothetical protein [Acholeplasmataceae bacterium]
MDYMYRFRSITRLLENKELENQGIYFAKCEELNDPVERVMEQERKELKRKQRIETAQKTFWGVVAGVIIGTVVSR